MCGETLQLHHASMMEPLLLTALLLLFVTKATALAAVVLYSYSS